MLDAETLIRRSYHEDDYKISMQEQSSVSSMTEDGDYDHNHALN